MSVYCRSHFAASLLAIFFIPACSDGALTTEDELVDQKSSDITVLKAEAMDPIGGNGVPGFDSAGCDAPADGSLMDCTKQFEERFQMPALHRILVPQIESLFFCKVLEVTTVSKKAAVEHADGVAFYYEGYSVEGIGDLIARNKLKKVGDATLKNGEAAVLHRFGGLANCDMGDGSSTAGARYKFKPQMQFTAPDTHEVYRNWDQADDYVLSTLHDRFDRSAELLQ